MTTTIAGQTYEIPEMWVAGYCRTHGGDARDAALAWHEQATLEKRANASERGDTCSSGIGHCFHLEGRHDMEVCCHCATERPWVDPNDDESDDGCPLGDPDCEGRDGDCHDACESPRVSSDGGHQWSRPNPEDAVLYCLNTGCEALLPMTPNGTATLTGHCPTRH